jgi:hypothetical protein
LLGLQSAMAATIQVMPPENDQLVNESDNFQITITGAGFADGSLGGGLDITWDPSVISFVSADTSAFPGDKILGNLGTLNAAAGLLQDLSVSSLFTAAPGPDFTIAVVTFNLLAGNIPTGINIGLGTFPSGAGNDVWTDSSSQEVIIESFSGAQINSAVIPVPAAVWLFGSALGILGWVRRRAA